jgi:hypothetical protein
MMDIVDTVTKAVNKKFQKEARAYLRPRKKVSSDPFLQALFRLCSSEEGHLTFSQSV